MFEALLSARFIRSGSFWLTWITIRWLAAFSAANPFLPTTYQTQLGAAKQTTFKLSELMGDFSRYHAVVDSRQWTYMAGLDGSLDAVCAGAAGSHTEHETGAFLRSRFAPITRSIAIFG